MSSIRAPIPPIPPFKGNASSTTASSGGGPLQPRTAAPQTTVSDRPASIVADRTAKLQAVIKDSSKHTSSGGKDYDPSTGRRTHASTNSSSSHAKSSATRSSETRSQQSSGKSRPQTRLEREKKKDFKDPANIGSWKLGKIIGQGASGRVRYAQHATTGQQAAVKIIPKNALTNSRMSLREAGAKQNKLTLGIEREIVIMKLIEHPNLIGLWDVYETSTELYLVMEYVAGGELFDHLVARGKLSSSEARSYFRQIIYGLDYCHRFNICHRDLKPENLLLDSTKRIVKLADFGMAALQPTEKMLETSCGSPHYASPEIVSGKSYMGSASDIWSCGIILFALLCGRLPFDDPNLAELLKKVRSGKFHMPEEVEPAAKGLIWRMLEVDPSRRITMPDIMRHPWFTNDGREPARNPVTTSFADLASESARLFAAGRDGVDPDILQNLRTLWPELSEDYIIGQLLCAGTNWQKTFYTLLISHRENHSAEDEDDDGPADQANTQGQSASTEHTGAVMGGTAISSKEKARPRRSVETPTDSPVKAKHTPAAAADAGDSVAANGRQSPVRPAQPSGPRAQASRTSLREKAKESSSARGASTTSAAVATTSMKAASESTSRRGSVSQERTNSLSQRLRPTGEDAPQQSPRVTARTSSRSASPTRPPSVSEGSSKRMSGAPTIAVPQVQDAIVQRFFQELADEIEMIRANGPSADHPAALVAKIAQFRSSIGAAASAAEAPPSTPVIGGPGPSPQMANAGRNDEENRFDDADDDVTSLEEAVGLLSSGAGLPSVSTDGQTAPLSIPSKSAQVTQRPPFSTVTSPNPSARKPVPHSRPGSAMSHHSGEESASVNAARNAKIKAAAIRVRADKASSAGGKENAGRAAPIAAPSLGAHLQAKGMTRLQQKNPGLGLDILAPTVSISAPEPPITNGPTTTLALPSPNPSIMSGASSIIAPSPKQSWFTGLFNWKPASCTLYSTENISATTTECRRLLHSYGIRTVVEDAESDLRVAVLKCASPEVRDPSGGHIVNKSVRFRVEFTILPVSSSSASSGHGSGSASLAASPAMMAPGTPRSSVFVPASPALSSRSGGAGSVIGAGGSVSGAGSVRAASIRSGTTSTSTMSASHGFATMMTLVQEKGALSTFKGVHSHLRRDWELDMLAPLSPAIAYPASPRLS
ncbi:unnamed protein product [Tilletia controversa]|uniref:non-specific serine/threonine protein kinase n=3 Tax=Tilletia TaxID=13289 RepID=A0A8X7SWJ2_9BASI|nr:hypothetical protein CF336_g976 [Tilletia laevis]KAE8202969.1 hypothetical protein CF328_g1907 [Tilletia controversa]KAE8264328.1 hypothetical protein A4X03_0g1028 [Tilletia caries]KAE8208344.1 hypothetical protein CF335_g484 [Tilletia laevis]KAE8247507.1 hypothetical protein A4X06_0g4401 [Tilletia controversa]